MVKGKFGKTSASLRQPDSNRDPLVSECKSLPSGFSYSFLIVGHLTPLMNAIGMLL